MNVISVNEVLKRGTKKLKYGILGNNHFYIVARKNIDIIFIYF